MGEESQDCIKALDVLRCYQLFERGERILESRPVQGNSRYLGKARNGSRKISPLEKMQVQLRMVNLCGDVPTAIIDGGGNLELPVQVAGWYSQDWAHVKNIKY